ncbi:MAG: extracellular solute-binding protein [Lachnospiraceae bacterium]|nr:extracellular solute-binding protein [Lachnospiraceae bacterium]
MKIKVGKYIILFMLALIVNWQFWGRTVVYAAQDEELSGTIEVISNVSEDHMKEYLEGFYKKYPNVEVKWTFYENYEEDVKKRIDSGDYGDVLFVPSYVGATEYTNYFVALGGRTLLSAKYNYMENSKNANDLVYGIPSSAYAVGILYNKDVFDQAGITEVPKTMEEFMQTLIDIKDRTEAIPFYTNYTDEWALRFWNNFPYVEMTGNADYYYNIVLGEPNVYLEGSTQYEVYKLLYDIVANGLCEEEPQNSGFEQAQKLLNEGKIACFVTGSWALAQTKEAGPNGDAIAFMPFPNEINGTQYVSVATDFCYGISKKSENRKAARAYIDYMLDESGYALDHERLSVNKTDPYPDSYGDMENVVLLIDNPAEGNNYGKWLQLSSNVRLEDGSGAKRIIEAASGISDESFEDITNDWHAKWESARTEDIPIVENEVEAIHSNVIITDEYEADFSPTERAFLKEQTQLRVGYLKNMAPFQYAKEGEFAGIAYEICSIVEENTGIDMEYYAFENTQQILEALNAKEIDMIAGIDKNAGYEGDIRYSREYLSCMNVVVRDDEQSMNFEESGTFAKVVGEKNVLNEGKEAGVIECASFAEAINKVEASEADYAVMNYYSADYYMKLEECKNVTMLPLSETGGLYLAFHKEVDTRLISICNKCIYGIPDNSIQVMLREYMVQPEKEVTLKRFIEDNPITCIMVVLGFCLLIVAAVVMVMQEKNKSAQKHAMDMQRYEFLASLVNEYLFEYDFRTDTISFDDKFRKKFGLPKELCMKDFEVRNEQGKVLEEIYRQYKDMKDDDGMTTAFQLCDKDNEVQWYRVFAHIIRDKNNKPNHLIGKVMNVQKEIEEKKEIEDKAHKDPLTGLYNREGFFYHLNKLYEKGETVEPMTVAVMDFDCFKSVNDTLGHAGGDMALCFLADTLMEMFANHAIVARYGGDEFMLMLYGMEEEMVRELLATLIRRMDTELVYHDITKKISISLGAVFTEEAVSFEEMFKVADMVLYQSKNTGKNRYGMMRFQEVESV